jgi:hypothetical protein
MGIYAKDCERSRFDKELRQIMAEYELLADISRDLFGIHAGLAKLIEELYEAVTGEDLGDKSDKEKFKGWADYAAKSETLNSPHEWDNISREAFLAFCSEIYDQNERILANAIGEKCVKDCKRRKIDWEDVA